MAKKTFDQSLKQLEQIVHELESNDLPLEKALKKFEEGIALSKACSNILDETEKKISLLLKDADGRIIETPFLPGDADSASQD